MLLAIGLRSPRSLRDLIARLRDVGIVETDIPDVARMALENKRLLVFNPRPLSQRDMEAVVRAAY